MQGILLQRTRQQDGAVVNAVDSQQGDSWLEPSWGLSLKFSCSYAFGGFLQVPGLPTAKTHMFTCNWWIQIGCGCEADEVYAYTL